MTAEPLASSLARDEKDGVVLVVGHSNTVPDLVKALGWPEPIRIADPATTGTSSSSCSSRPARRRCCA